MMNPIQITLIKKDLRSITSNKRMFSVLLIVPLVLTLLIPSIFVFTIVYAPSDMEELSRMLDLFPSGAQLGDPTLRMLSIILNNALPVFFLLIPIMAASVMAASSFVGEKEKRTLETLLYCPLSLKQLFSAKIFASFLLSMMVSFLSFFAMMLVLEAEIWFTLGTWILPDISWLILMLLVSPAISLIAITLIVRGSAKAQTMEESQQRSVFLILPIILLAAGQFSGFMLISPWFLLGLGALFAAAAYFTMKSAYKKFHYEALLK